MKNCDPKKSFDKKSGAGVKADTQKYTHEHQKIRSRTTGRDVEISMGPHGGGLVPKNPFASIAQAGYLHAHPEKVGGKTALDEWDKSTNFSSLPKKKK